MYLGTCGTAARRVVPEIAFSRCDLAQIVSASLWGWVGKHDGAEFAALWSTEESRQLGNLHMRRTPRKKLKKGLKRSTCDNWIWYPGLCSLDVPRYWW